MRFLIDNSLSWRLAKWLGETGHDAIHVRDIGLGDAPDQVIYSRASSETRILVTQDVDFGALLALDANPTTSVVLYRLNDGRLDIQTRRFADLLSHFAAELIPGTIVVLTDATTRIRRF
jgi:predicted nuclease of predicted toxin-antitoxin system